MASSAGQKLIAGRMPGERIKTEVITSDSASFTSTEGQIASITGVAVVEDRIYRVTVDVAIEPSVDGVVRLLIYEDSTSGTRITLRDFVVDASGTACACRLEVEWTADTTEAKTFVVTGKVQAGAGMTAKINANSDFPSYIYVDYIRG